MCGSMADIQFAAAEIRRGKKRRKKNKPQHENIYGLPIPLGDHKPGSGRYQTSPSLCNPISHHLLPSADVVVVVVVSLSVGRRWNIRPRHVRSPDKRRRHFPLGQSSPLITSLLYTSKRYRYLQLSRNNKLIRNFSTMTPSTTFMQCRAPRKATEFGEITQNKAHYPVQGYSRQPILVPIESS